MRGYVTHTHLCDRCNKVSVSCRSIPIQEEDGRYCPVEAHPESVVCEDCWNLSSCAYCGLWGEQEMFREWDKDLFCERCIEVVKREESVHE